MAILCHCEGVNDREIDAAVAAGARCVDAVTEACGAGRGCGTCHLWIHQILERHGVVVTRSDAESVTAA
jgi:bacterioferritin-associated ferredoxin